jgi:hypothetical protein
MRCPPLLIALAVLAGCGAEPEPPARVSAPAPTPIRSEAHGFTAELPAGWHLTPRTLTPALSNPVEILSAGTVAGARPERGGCAQVPVGALERLGPRDAFVTVQERYGEPRFPPRPYPFTLPPPSEGIDAEVCVRHPERLEFHWFGFRDAGRGFHVLAVLGRDAPPQRRQEVEALLDSLRFEPGPAGVRLDPDRAVRFEDRAAGLAWVMPVPPWRRYERGLTSTQGERLALGTFDVPPAPPDGNCTPRAAIDAMPSDGAFIFLWEYVDITTPALEDFPPRAGPMTLGPEIAYECMGESRMVAWQDRGRAFQAHVYFGPRATAGVRRDALSILNSIQALPGK